ncbi:hypothetical protein ALP71_01254 [Pseudomonas coronafaciens pv. garcae]|nr:hypothetical protein ALP71_01254 [Pseudomonas coronafaciens pv. garcae]
MSRSFGLVPLTSSPSMRIAPPLMLSSPAMQFISVDLPQPDGPTRIRNSPSFIDSSMFFSVSGKLLP